MKKSTLAVMAGATVALSTMVACACLKSDPVYPGVDLEPKGNPIFTDAWTCDPAPLLVGNTVYVYTGSDDARPGENDPSLPGGYKIVNWRVYSSTDLVHWRSYGTKLASDSFKGGLKNTSWASQCVEKDGKFYWYATYRDDINGGQSIGVAVADTPIGPFKPLDNPVVKDSMTKGRGWNDIDPTVLIDDDGTAWLAWGNGNSYLAKLKPNMVELDGEPIDLHLQSYVEGPWLYKRNGLYYNIYAGFGGGGGECINYSTAEKITGPWTFRGRVCASAKNSFTTHPGVLDFKGRTFLFYHNGTLDRDGRRGGSLNRSVCMDELFFNEDGTIKEVVQTTTSLTKPVK